MNTIINSFTGRVLNVGAIFVLVVGTSVAFPLAAHAQSDDGCCSDDSSYVDSGDYSYPVDDSSYTDSGDYSYPTDDSSYVDSADYTYPEDDSSYVDSADYTYPEDDSSYTDSADYTYPEDDSSYVDSADYTYPVNSATPEYSEQTPSYSSIGGTSATYSSAPFTITAPNYVSQPISAPQPIYVPTPVIHNNPAPQPIVYNTPTPSVTNNTCVNYSCNTTTTTTNTNTNTNTNINTAPVVATVTPVYQTPVQQTVQYVFPQQQPIAYPTYYSTPISCTITAIPNSVSYNQPTTLYWSAPGATSATISGVGSVAASGSLTARPLTSSNYTVTVWGPQGQTSTCNVWVTVAGSTVSLTQIPYTGFDFGPFGDAMYWLGLLAFAGAAGYLLVYYRGGAMMLATEALRGNRRAITVSTATAPDEDIVAPTPVVASKPVFVSTPVTNRATEDAMSIAHGHGEMPRIVITRA